MTGGWIKLHRDLLESHIWERASDSRKVFLIQLLAMVNYEKKEWVYQGQQYTCLPGEVITSQNILASKLKVTKKTIQTTLLFFQEIGFLEIEATSRSTKIRIKHWAKYQLGDQQVYQLGDQQVYQQESIPEKVVPEVGDQQVYQLGDQQVSPTKERIIKKEEINNPPTPQGGVCEKFEIFWKAYPRHEAKAKALSSWKRQKLDSKLDIILENIERLKNSDQWVRGFIPHATTFLNQQRWEDEIFEAPPTKRDCAGNTDPGSPNFELKAFIREQKEMFRGCV